MYFVFFPFAFSVFKKNYKMYKRYLQKNEDVLFLYIINNVEVSV